jgi:DUF4097 and DUF4098 domain-containing protein YvlB
MHRNTRAASWIVPLCALLSGCDGLTQPLEEIFDRTYPIDPGATISLTSIDGSVQIYGSDKPEVRLQAIKKAYTAAPLHSISVNVSARPNSILVETIFPPKKNWSFSDRSGTVDYTIVVPQTARIARLELKNGEISVAGMQGDDVRANLGNGRLFIRNCFCDVQAREATGALILIYDWWNPRKFSANAQIADGNLFAVIPGDASFHLIAEAANGKIGNDFAEKEQRTGTTVTKADTLVGASAQATINLRAIDGNIKIVEANP